MKLERVSPGPLGFEHRLFECARCDEAQTNVIASDPIKSSVVGWIKGEDAAKVKSVMSGAVATATAARIIAAGKGQCGKFF
jgi:hypothetical protein